tara:strand:- start:30 stop:296 length:267 start_codon:yes stop_codon:yes gene_type:complete
MADDNGLTHHEITIYLAGGATLGTFKAAWSKHIVSDVRELTKDYHACMRGKRHNRFKYHLHDQEQRAFQSLIMDFNQVNAISDRVVLH